MEYQAMIKTMPVIALRGITIFPGMILHFDVGREASVRALEEAMETDQTAFLVAPGSQRGASRSG
jgi:ATP-dependent Lon protease